LYKFLKGAFFVDAGNIWNFKNTKADGSIDSSQFKFKNLYKQLGLSAGTGFRLDFNYFLIRLDMGFRFKRPDIAEYDGWQFPDINFKNLFGNDPANKRWRYENFNFTIGIDYPF
jgi:outer membrane protein assembly factor BamA